MLKTFMHYTLILILLLQSIAGAADAHQFHQDNNQHQELSNHHFHESDFVDLSDSQNDKFNCHHCCHCHTAGHHALPITASQFIFTNANVDLPSYRFISLVNQSNTFNRPPIV